MQSNEFIKKNIETIKGHQAKLYSYLYDLVDKPLSTDIRLLEDVYCSFLNDNRDEIKKISIYALLFFLKIKKDKYKYVALQWAENIFNNEEFRLFCIAGLSQAFMDSKDPKLLSSFYEIFNNHNEDSDLRTEGFLGMMKVIGLSTIAITQKNENILIMNFDDIQIDNFIQEMQIVNQLKDSL
jgi:hypothetical protein